jgi:hypothetical protein
MRHWLAGRRLSVVTVESAAGIAHLAATAYLCGVGWLVQLALYPAFATVGPTTAWPDHHREHSRALTLVVGPPWAVQGLALAVLLVTAPGPLVLLAAALGLAPVVVTIVWSLRCHATLSTGYDEQALASLLSSNRVRALLWTGGVLAGAAHLG